MEKNRHLLNIGKILDFLKEEDISYSKDINTDDVYHLNEGKLQIRYVDSFKYKIDYSKRFGIEGVEKNYFNKISKNNKESGIRTIWIKDWEMEEVSNIIDVNGKTIENYPRKWNVLKSYIKTACGKIDTKIYARNCDIKIVPNTELRSFLSEHSFYGYRSAACNLGLYLKKDINNIPAGTLLMVYTFGFPFFANKKTAYDVEVIRVATKINCQVIGGASKLLRYFLENYPKLVIGKKEVEVNNICFYVDADHNDGDSLKQLGFNFVKWTSSGFMNVEKSSGKVFHRKPMMHKQIMERMSKGEVYSVANAGTIVYELNKQEYLKSN
jgi:hypothetical protein